MSSLPDDLTNLKDDMIAFVEGHGMRRFPGFVHYDEVQCIVWDSGDNTDSWKDFVELAKASGTPFLTMHSWTMTRDELEELGRRLTGAQFVNDEDLEEARWLRTYLGKTGSLQLGWPYQGSVMLYEISTEWCDRYQRLVELCDEFGEIPIDESDQDDEH